MEEEEKDRCDLHASDNEPHSHKSILEEEAELFGFDTFKLV